MPEISLRTSVPANDVVANILAGSQYEFLPVDAFVEFALIAAAFGVRATVTTGTDILADDVAISFANRFPIYPDDYSLNDAVLAGERMVVRLRNTTGAAINVDWVVKITPS